MPLSWPRVALAVALLGGAAGVVKLGADDLLPRGGAVGRGLRVDGQPIANGVTPADAARAAAARVLARRVVSAEGTRSSWTRRSASSAGGLEVKHKTTPLVTRLRRAISVSYTRS